MGPPEHGHKPTKVFHPETYRKFHRHNEQTSRKMGVTQCSDTSDLCIGAGQCAGHDNV